MADERRGRRRSGLRCVREDVEGSGERPGELTEGATAGGLPDNGGEARLAKDRVERDEEDLVRRYLTDIGQYPH